MDQSLADDAGPIEDLIVRRLAALTPIRLEVYDDSARHVGHAGAGDGGHYRLLVVSPVFAGMPRLARHRLVHTALGALFARRIHALNVQAMAPDEVRASLPIAS